MQCNLNSLKSSLSGDNECLLGKRAFYMFNELFIFENIF